MPDPTSPASPRRNERTLPLHAPVRAWALAEWALLPLRAFLGATFIYAGLQKLDNPNFFNKKSPISIYNQLIAASRTSPIHVILSHLEGVAKPIGLAMAFGELFVGVGVLLGLWTRVAAIGGAIISFSLFLTVSFHASPWFTGADIVYFFAWMPLILAGGGTRLSADAWIANRSAAKESLPAPELVPIAFSTVQSLCGAFAAGACALREGAPCDAAACPVLIGAHAPVAIRGGLDTVDRRSLVFGTAVAAAVGTGVLIFGGAAADTGALIGDAPKPTTQDALGGSLSATPTTTTPTTTTPTSTTPASTPTTTPVATPKGKLLGNVDQVPTNSAASFTIPENGDPGIVIHEAKGGFVAYNAVCPHMGCTVGYSSSMEIIVCPCHGSEFNVKNGNVIVGPAPHGLTKLKLAEGANGNLYLE